MRVCDDLLYVTVDAVIWPESVHRKSPGVWRQPSVGVRYECSKIIYRVREFLLAGVKAKGEIILIG